MDATSYRQELRMALSLVHDKEYQEVIGYLSTCGRGCFCNQGIWINDAIIDYCKNKLS